MGIESSLKAHWDVDGLMTERGRGCKIEWERWEKKMRQRANNRREREREKKERVKR